MSNQAKILAAAVYGTQAFKNGRKCIPCQDARLMALLAGNQIGEGEAVLAAWSEAWHDANLCK